MSVFDVFKREKAIARTVAKAHAEEDIFFLTKFDETGAYIALVDDEGNEVDIDYQRYSGAWRSLLKTIEEIKARDAFTINWENPDKKIYLHEHSHLIPALAQTDRWVNEKWQGFTITEAEAKLTLHISPVDENHITAKLILQIERKQHEDFKMITDEYVLATDGNEVALVKPTGIFYNRINYFNVDRLHKMDLQKYLSLFFSYMRHIGLQYEPYTIVKIEEPLQPRPALVFEKVDEENNLFMRLSQSLSNVDIRFLGEYEVSHLAFINDIEKQIQVQPVEPLYLEEQADALSKILNKGKSRRGSDIDFIEEEWLYILPEEAASDFVYKTLPSLLTTYVIAGSEKLKKYRINVMPPKLNVQLGHGIDFLEGSATLDFGEQSISLMDALQQYEKNRYIVLADGSHALVNESYMQRLQRLFKKKKEKVVVSFFDLPLIEDLIEERVATEQFAFAKEIFAGFNDIAKKKPKLPQVHAELRSYQKQGFAWLQYLVANKLGGCLADDMGLGKTLQTITLLSAIYANKQERPSLIVMPRSLLFNWQKELQRFAPHLTYYTWYAGERDMEQARGAHVIMTTYAMLRNDIQVFKEEHFLLAVLDESQAIKNMQSQLHKAVMLVKADHRLALSGTPIENNLAELYALFRFLNPAMFGSAESFNQQYLSPIQKHNDATVMQELRKKIYPFILRRLKADVLKELPDKIEQTLYVEMSADQAKYYEQRRMFYKNAIDQQVAMKGIQQAQFFIFQAMNELRQIASMPESQTEGRIASPKLEMLMEQVDEAIANRHKILIFTNYLAAVELVGEELNRRGIYFETLTGSTRNRGDVVENFQNNPDCKALVLTLKTGGFGLNLTAADMVFIFDPWWNKAAENQAIDRAHRMGQDKKVMSYKLITLGTIEEKILQLQEMKSKLFDDLIGTDGASLKSMSEADINFILGK